MGTFSARQASFRLGAHARSPGMGRIKKPNCEFLLLVSALYQRSRPIYAISRAENINNRNDKNAKWSA